MPLTITLAFLGGVLPALIWLAFWLWQDRRQSEPRWLIAAGFFGGAASVAVALVFEQYAAGILAGTLLLVVWAVIEEVVKFVFAWALLLTRRAYNEPVDALIYLITIALGFAAAENTLFLFKTLEGEPLSLAVMTGNLRFIGATLLHVLASATIGVCIALTYYSRRYVQRIATGMGIILASALHALFNALIIESNGEKLLLTFVLVWIGIVALLLAFEKAKRLKRRHSRITTHH